MNGTLSAYGINKVYILGAGFSAPLGMPLTYDLLKLIYKVAVKKPWYGDGGKPIPYGMGAWLADELSWYFPLEDFSHDKLQDGRFPENFDIEKFLSYVFATSAFGEQWDDQGDKFFSFLRMFLGEAIYNEQLHCFKSNPSDIYSQFVETLDKSLIMTFNWDTVLEHFIKRGEKNYSYDFADALETNDIPIFKLHGSIDWFSNIEHKKKDWMNFTPVYRPSKGIENGKIIYDDPVLFKANGSLLKCYNDAYMSPRIIAPGYDKLSQVTSLGNYWKNPWVFLQDRIEIIIIGFSMRPDDYHSRAFIYPQLVEGSRNDNLKIKVIDYAADDVKKNEIRERFEGVENISYWFDGFNEGALDFINE